jgi:hypothetical protein
VTEELPYPMRWPTRPDECFHGLHEPAWMRDAGGLERALDLAVELLRTRDEAPHLTGEDGR